MDFDLENNSEDGHRPDPLFDSIMNAMNSMKEATADKIYHKIQREGETNYSRPQVDRALASALKYGIFEVKNNRYRVRDNVLDDEDTVYWKLQKKREQTPFRIQDDINERQFGPKLDPERDNQRFRKISSTEAPECPQCGRTKKPSEEQNTKLEKKTINHRVPKIKKRNPSNKRRMKTSYENNSETPNPTRKTTKRKKHPESVSNERCQKMRKIAGPRMNQPSLADPTFNSFKETERQKLEENKLYDRSKYDTTDSEMDSLSTPSDDEQSFISYHKNDSSILNSKNYKLVSECVDVGHPDNTIMQGKRSSVSIKSESDSERSEITSVSDDGHSQSRPNEAFFENLPCTSGSKATDRNQYQRPNEIFSKQSEKDPTDYCEKNLDWMKCSDEPQGAIIQCHNLLTIEPMELFAFKGPEQASYIS